MNVISSSQVVLNVRVRHFILYRRKSVSDRVFYVATKRFPSIGMRVYDVTVIVYICIQRPCIINCREIVMRDFAIRVCSYMYRPHHIMRMETFRGVIRSGSAFESVNVIQIHGHAILLHV